MSAWKHSAKLYLSPIMDEIRKAGKERDPQGFTRESIFFRMLSYSADGFDFSNALHMSKVIGTPAMQTSLVWDICVKHGILAKGINGYSAIQWMHENNLLVESVQNNQQSEPNKIPSQSVVKPITPKDEPKECVRPNVRLTRTEINTLKEEFSDEEITQLLDNLSEYKTSSGKYYASDYDAIRRWGVRRLRQDQAQLKKNKSYNPKPFTDEDFIAIYGQAAFDKEQEELRKQQNQ